MDSDRKLDFVQQALRFSLGGTAVAAGADKFFNLLTDWDKYLSPAARDVLPMSGRNFMRLVGGVEIGAGALVLSGKSRLGGYLVGAWLLAIAANLIANRDYDIAVRDINMAVGAVALAELTAVRQRARDGLARVEKRQVA